MTPPTPRAPLHVLVVDDSPSVRAVLRRFFSWTDDIEVVGEASDGREAVEKVLALHPDVILMDLLMPEMDGYRATERIMEVRPTPIVVLSSTANRNQMRIAFEAMRRGAVEVLGKPEDTDSWKALAETLPEMVRTAAAARTRPLSEADLDEEEVGDGVDEVIDEVVEEVREDVAEAPEEAVATARVPLRPRALRWVAVGASTGGPAALREMLEALPDSFPMTMLVVQHITDGFEAGLADWLNREFVPDIRLAEDGEEPPPGSVRLAPCGAHLLLEPGGVLRLDRTTGPVSGHRPSVDALFGSLARSHPESGAGVLLTGMGSDGVDGLLAVRQAGGLTLAQDRASSVVWGMPRVAFERGAVEIALPPAAIARYLERTWRRARRRSSGGGSR